MFDGLYFIISVKKMFLNILLNTNASNTNVYGFAYMYFIF